MRRDNVCGTFVSIGVASNENLIETSNPSSEKSKQGFTFINAKKKFHHVIIIQKCDPELIKIFELAVHWSLLGVFIHYL